MVKLADLAYGISSDKGNMALVGIAAIEPADYELIDDRVTEERVAEHFGDVIDGPVEKYRLPNVNGFNFVLHGALGGGGAATLQADKLGKTYAAALLRMEIEDERTG